MSHHMRNCQDHVDVPADMLGVVIGKHGKTIQFINTVTGAFLTTRPDLPNRVFISAETEDAIERAKQEISRIISIVIRKSKSRERRTFSIDPQQLGDDRQMRLLRTVVPEFDKKFYRLVPATGTPQEREPRESGDTGLLQNLFKAAEEVLVEIRKEADERPDTSPLQVDVWVHLGQQLLSNIDNREACSAYSIPTVLAKVKNEWKWMIWLGSGIDGLAMDWMDKLLSANSDEVRTSVRHDIGFYTPLGQDRRFKVWIPTETSCASAKDDEAGADNGSAIAKAGPGFLSTRFSPRLRADVALPGRQFDCRLLIRSGVKDRSGQSEAEKEEDTILIKSFCEKVEFKSHDLVLPPLPPGYRLHFKRRSERNTYSINGFELTTSRETYMEYDRMVRPEEQHKIDLHIHSKACEALLSADSGRSWRPKDVLQLIPDVLKFVKEELNLLETGT